MTTTRFTSCFSEHERAIGRALETTGEPVTDVGRGHWRVALGEDDASSVYVRLRSGWVVCCSPIEAPFDGPTNVLERYLRLNGRLFGRSKVVLDPARTTPLFVREDIPVVDGVDVAQACTGAIANLAQTKKRLAVGRTLADRERKMAALPPAFVDTIEEVSAAVGWSHCAKDAETSVVTLDGPGGSYKAAVAAHASGDYRISAHLSRHRSLSSIARRALAVFLLTANGLVRYARAGIERSAGATSALFEVRYPGQPSAALMETALSALAVACGMCARELAVLSDESVARRYLAAREAASVPAKEAAATIVL